MFYPTGYLVVEENCTSEACGYYIIKFADNVNKYKTKQHILKDKFTISISKSGLGSCSCSSLLKEYIGSLKFRTYTEALL